MNRSITGMIAAIAIAICGILAGASAQAQTSVDVFNGYPPVPPPPPQTGCGLELTLFDGGSPANQAIFFVQPGGTTTVTFPPGFTPIGAISAAGTKFNFVNGCTPCIAMHSHVTPTSTCCAVVCYNPNTLPNPSITLTPCTTNCQP